MVVVALTGGIGSGKSLVGEFLGGLGALVVDSDQVARDVIERGTPGYDAIVTTFGDEILEAGNISRAKLAALVFSHSDSRLELEKITHPLIRQAFDSLVKAAPEDCIIVYQIPLLVETKGADRFDFIINVQATPEIRALRLHNRGMSAREIESRMAAQAREEERTAIADVTLVNNGSKEDLLRQVEELWERELKPRLARSLGGR